MSSEERDRGGRFTPESSSETYRLRIDDPRIIALVLTIVLIISLYIPVAMPLPVSPWTQGFWDEISGLQEGDYVLCDAKVISSEVKEMGPAERLVIRYLHERKYKVIYYVTEPDALPLAAEFLTTEYGGLSGSPEYGDTFVYLGAIPGSKPQGASVDSELAFCANLHIMAVDYAGTPLSAIPIISDVLTLDDPRIKLVVTLTSRGLGTHVQSYVISYAKRYIASLNAMELRSYIPTYMANLVHGLLGGNRGGAEFELLTGYTGPNMAVLFAMSMGCLFLIVGMLGRNIQYYLRRRTT
jgi:hypothetical protein